MKRNNPAHVAWRALIAKQNVRAAYLHAKHRVITAKLAQGRKQLTLPIDLKEAS